MPRKLELRALGVTPAGIGLGLVAGLLLGVGAGWALFGSGGGRRDLAQATLPRVARERISFDGVPADVKERAVEQLRAQDVIDEENGEVYFNVDKAIDQLEKKEQGDRFSVDGDRQEGLGPTSGEEDDKGGDPAR